MSTSNTQRTLRALRQQGCICGIVERWNQFAAPKSGGIPGIREDLFGFLDIIALYPTGICGIQSCGQAFSEHNKKILANEVAPEWLKSGGRIELWGWRKVKKVRGGKQEVWKPRIKEYFAEDFENAEGEEVEI